MSGSGLFSKNGTGTQTLSGANTYTGGTRLNAGVISIGNANGLGSSGNITFVGGGLQYGAAITTDLSNRIKNSTGAVLIDTNGNTVTFSNALDSSNSGGLTKNGTGTLTLSAANSYTGNTTVNAGTLALGISQTLGAIAGAGSISLSSYNLTTNATGSTTFSGNISGTGSLTKSGAGTLTLSGANTYSGATSVSGVMAVWGDTISSGTLTGSPYYGNYGALQLDGNLSSTTGITISNGGTFLDGNATAAGNNGISNRINTAATLTMNGGTFTMVAPAAGNTHSQSLTGLVVGPGFNTINASGSTAITALSFTGAGGSVYSRSTGGMVNFVTTANNTISFTNAPTANVSGSGADAILVGAFLNSTDFVAAAAGNLTAATYATTLTAGKNVNVTGNLSTSGSVSINSIRFNTAAQNVVTVGASDTLTIASGGIIAGSATIRGLATAIPGITGGNLTSGTNELFFSGQNSTDERSNFLFAINSRIVDNGAPVGLNITGNGSLVLTNPNNSFTGNITMNGGKLALSGYNATRTTVTDGVLGGTNTILPQAAATH
jgi:autotransporter-associated beta strand protein